MQNIIVLLLVLLVIEAALSLWSNGITLRRNERVALNGEEKATAAMNRALKNVEYLGQLLERERGKHLAPAFIITSDGVKILPEGWQKHFEFAWNAPAAVVKAERVPTPHESGAKDGK